MLPTFIDWLQWITKPSLERRLKSANEALEALESQRTQKKAALVPSKPADSRVVLKKENERLEIYIPTKGFSIDLLPNIVFATIWNGFLVNWYSHAISSWSSFGWFMAFFAIGHLGVGIWLIIQILFTLLGKTRLSIDKKKISLRYQLFGLSYYCPRPAARQTIIKLERTKTSYVKVSKGGTKKVKPQINIWAGTKKFSIGRKGLLSEVELDWLAHELSEWLNLPISRAC